MRQEIVWAEMARRKIKFHNNTDWQKIRPWGLFSWGCVSKLIKQGKLLAPGYSRENKIVWVYPSEETYQKHIKPLLDKYSLNELTHMAGWNFPA